ncbi:MAG TPA: hypothetical protein VF571_03075 [Pyrinomonadaceae bacterium]
MRTNVNRENLYSADCYLAANLSFTLISRPFMRYLRQGIEHQAVEKRKSIAEFRQRKGEI